MLLKIWLMTSAPVFVTFIFQFTDDDVLIHYANNSYKRTLHKFVLKKFGFDDL